MALKFLNDGYFAGKVGIGTESPLDELQIGNYTGSNSLSITSADGANYAELKLREFNNNYGITFKLDSNLDILNILYHNNSTSGQSAMAISRTTGNVGIGTTSPGAKLEVNGGEIRTTRENVSANYLSLSTTSAGSFIKNAGGTGKGLTLDNVSATSPYINFKLLSSEKMRVTSAGNVGIGTTSPGAKLEVVSARGAEGIHLNDGSFPTVGKVMLDVDANGDGEIRLRNSNSTLTSVISGGEDSYLLGGNVGIGTTSPSAKLHVNSSDATTVQRIQGATNSALEFYNSSTKTGAILVNSTQFLIAADNSNYLNINTGGSERMRITSAGNVGIGVTAPLDKLHVNGRVRTSTDGVVVGDTNAVIYRNSNDLELITYGGFDINLMPAGNVGIGTTAPNYVLDISKNNASILNLHRPNSSTAAASFLDFSFNTANATEAVYARIRSDVEVNTNSAQGGDLSFHTANAGTVGEVMRLTQEGNVGIGTDSPSNRLEIVGPYSSTPLKVLRHGDYGNVINLGRNGVSETANIGYPADATLNFSTSGTERMRIDASGNVGIGTTSPSAKLEVTGNTRLGSGTFHVSSDATLITSATYTFRDGVYINNPNSTSAAVASGNVMSIGASSGNTVFTSLITTGAIGIGKSNPSAQLDVVGTGNFTGLVSGITPVNAANFVTKAYVDGSGGGTGPFLPLAGGTMTGVAGVVLPDNFILNIGTSNDLTIKHNATDSFIENHTGHLSVVNYANDKDIILWGDDGTGGISKYLVLEGVSTNAYFSNPGNVGIGTTSPAEKLHVFGGAAAIEIDSTTNEASLKYDNSTTTANIKLANNDLKTELGGTEVMRILANGNVGIGTTSPGAKLEISHSGSNSGLLLENTLNSSN